MNCLVIKHVKAMGMTLPWVSKIHIHLVTLQKQLKTYGSSMPSLSAVSKIYLRTYPTTQSAPNTAGHGKRTHLRIRRKINRQMPIQITLIGLRARLKQMDRRIPMALRDSMMQRRQAIHIRRADGTLAVLEQDLDNRGRADGSRSVEGQLAALVFHSCAAFVRDQDADGGEVCFRGSEVEGVLGRELVSMALLALEEAYLARTAFNVHVGAFAE